MSASYLTVIRTPGALPVFLSAIIGRMSFATVTLGCIVLLASTTGSYAIAGTTSGALGLANVVLAPWRARFVSRRGQRLGLRLLALAYAAGVGALAAAATWHAPVVVLIGLAGFAGAVAPPVGAAMRMRWRRLVVGEEYLQKAYSLDAVSEELVFTIGPVLAGLLMGAVIPQAGLLASAVLAIIGCFGMTRGVQQQHQPESTPGGFFQLRIFRTRGFAAVLIATAATGVVIGTVDVVIPAQTAPDDTLSGLLLGAMALGSGVGGLAYGARAWPGRPTTRLTVLAIAMAAACAGLGLAPVGLVLAAGLVITGLTLAPAMVTGYLAVDQCISDADRLEAHTWVNTAVNAGAAAASALGGIALGHVTPALAFVTAACLATLLVAGAAISQRRTSNVTTAH